MNIDFDTELLNLHARIVQLLEKYKQHIMTFVQHTDLASLAQYILNTKACNSFYSATIPCMKGLHIESYNAVRTGLECGWLGILLCRNIHFIHRWLIDFDENDPLNKNNSRYKKKFGRQQWVRDKIATSAKEKEQRDNLYGILSTKSHANVASTFFIAEGNQLIFYEPSGIESIHHKYKNLKGIKYCFEYMLSDIQKSFGVEFGIERHL